MNNYQKLAAEMAKKYGLSRDAMIRYADLVSEVGEVGKELLVGGDYGDKKIQPTESLARELGDVVFSLVSLANCLNLDLEECFAAAAEKYEIRFSQSGRIGSR
ncbi:MAG: hypothetical protein FWC93_03575 [Defluviitaleaceae bacterium]|nr:hypothetical protein [Defluviitaleaceae bacterium]